MSDDIKLSTVEALKSKKGFVIAIALLSLYLFWGGTYLGMRIAIETMPPFIMAGVRFIAAGLILYPFARLRGAKRPASGEWKGAGIVGALLLLGGNGMVAWAEQTVPSGIAALIVATVPIWIILISMLGKDRKKPGIGVAAGIVLGFSGIVVLVLQSLGNTEKGLDLAGMAVMLLASLSWSAGSMYSRKARLPESPLLSTAMQMLVGGALLFIASFFTGEWSRLDIAQISLRSYAALGYLVLFGSIIAYNAYIWLLKNADPSWVSTYAFVNPVIAVFLGWFIAGEELTVYSLAAAIIIVAAVVIITIFRNRRK